MVEPSQPNLDKYITYGDRSANDFVHELRDKVHAEAAADPAAYWAKLALNLKWDKMFSKIIDTSDKYLHRWFPDGEMNICYNCVDRHVEEGRGKNVAFYEDSVYTGVQRAVTYKELQDQVGRLANVFTKHFGIKKGDRVLIYMPMVIEAAFAMLACARIGATHSVVFGGFSAKELSNRIDDCTPSLIILASTGIEPGKHIPYPPIIEEALSMCQRVPDAQKTIPRLIKQRRELDGKLAQDNVDKQYYHDYDALMEAEKEVAPCVPLPSTHPLYILYTSGTTGQPKGVVRDTGGTAVGLDWCMAHVFDVHSDSVHFAGSDIGWVVGHSFIIYGPLLRGCASVFFEGKPVVPDPGVMWQKCAQYKVTSLYMAPTAVRVIKKLDYDGEHVVKHDTSSVRTYSLVGERCDPDTIKWMHKHLPHCIINDTWWQTETGWPISANLPNFDVWGKILPTLPGSVTRPVPGYNVKVFNEQNQQCAPLELGKVVIKMPLPPAFMLTLWGNDQAFIDKYLADTPGYYTTGDAGVFDDHGYLHIMTRVDDVINTAGHRISTGRLEESVNDHPEVVESAVVGYNEPLRGECPLAFVVLKGRGTEVMDEQTIKKLQAEINNCVRTDVGAFCRMIGVIFMQTLPKTRSGKILRGTIRSICNRMEYKMPATIDDASTLDQIKNATEEWYKTIPAESVVQEGKNLMQLNLEVKGEKNVALAGDEEKE